MPITTADLKEYKSLNVNSDGGAISGVEVINNVDNNLFTDITGNEAAAGPGGVAGHPGLGARAGHAGERTGADLGRDARRLPRSRGCLNGRPRMSRGPRRIPAGAVALPLSYARQPTHGGIRTRTH